MEYNVKVIFESGRVEVIEDANVSEFQANDIMKSLVMEDGMIVEKTFAKNISLEFDTPDAEATVKKLWSLNDTHMIERIDIDGHKVYANKENEQMIDIINNTIIIKI